MKRIEKRRANLLSRKEKQDETRKHEMKTWKTRKSMDNENVENYRKNERYD